MYFRYYRLSKTWLHHSLKCVVSEHLVTVKMLKGPKHLRNLHESTFTIFFRTLMSCKVSPIVKFEIFRLSVNTLIADDKYPVRDCKNIQFSIQMQLCQKRNTFSQYFVLLGEFTANFKRFEKKMIVIANVLPILQTVEDLVGPLSKKRHFRTSFYSQHVKLSQTLLKPT